MAWRPNEQFIEGVLDNTVPGKVTGWMRFIGKKETVIFELEGNFHRDIRGAKVMLHGNGESVNTEESTKYMEIFSALQKGNVGDMTAGKSPQDYVDYPYFEWYSEENGRVVLEFEPEQIELLSPPIPACESDPVSREQQNSNMAEFLMGIAQDFNIPSENAICFTGKDLIKAQQKNAAVSSISATKLLTQEIRKQLPALYSQDGLGGKAIVHVKFFTPDSNWTWYGTYVELGISCIMWS